MDVETIADLVFCELNPPGSLKTIVHNGASSWRQRFRPLDSAKVLPNPGWEPYVPLVPRIRQATAWYRDNEAWWRPLTKRAAVTDLDWVRYRAAA